MEIETLAVQMVPVVDLPKRRRFGRLSLVPLALRCRPFLEHLATLQVEMPASMPVVTRLPHLIWVVPRALLHVGIAGRRPAGLWLVRCLGEQRRYFHLL